MKIASINNSYSCGLINWWHLDAHILCFFILLPDKSAFMFTGSRHYHDRHTRSSQACLICNIHTHCKAGMNAICHPPNPAQLTKRTIVDIHVQYLRSLCHSEFLNGKLLKKYCSILLHHLSFLKDVCKQPYSLYMMNYFIKFSMI